MNRIARQLAACLAAALWPLSTPAEPFPVSWADLAHPRQRSPTRSKT